VKVKIHPKALATIDAISDFVESKNTKGSGRRYAMRFKATILKLAIPNIDYPVCHHPTLAQFKYSCSHFNDWVIVFKVNQNKELVVYEIIHASLLG